MPHPLVLQLRFTRKEFQRALKNVSAEEAIRRFAGEDIGRAVFYPQDESFLIETEDRVSHFEVAFQEGWESL